MQEDLKNTIGESAAQGSAGIILWGSHIYSSSKVSVAGGTMPLPLGTPHSLPTQGCDAVCHCRRCA